MNADKKDRNSCFCFCVIRVHLRLSAANMSFFWWAWVDLNHRHPCLGTGALVRIGNLYKDLWLTGAIGHGGDERDLAAVLEGVGFARTIIYTSPSRTVGSSAEGRAVRARTLPGDSCEARFGFASSLMWSR